MRSSPYYDTWQHGRSRLSDRDPAVVLRPRRLLQLRRRDAPDSTGGYVYIFDPVFCETDVASGTGDRHFNGDGDAVSSFYELYDTGTSLFSRADDTPHRLVGEHLHGDGLLGPIDGRRHWRERLSSEGDLVRGRP